MYCAGLPRAVSHGVTVLVAGMLVSTCGVPPDQPETDDNVLELTFVDPRQYNTPSLVTAPGEPTLYRVTTDVTLVFRFADQLEILIVDLTGPQSGRHTHNEFNLAVLAPGIAAVTEGRWEIRVPLTIPELGALQFRVTVANHDGTMSREVAGGFTVQASFGADNTIQAKATQIGTTTESVGP